MNRIARSIVHNLCATISVFSLVAMNPARASNDAQIPSFIDGSSNGGMTVISTIKKVDETSYFWDKPREVLPGAHVLTVATCVGNPATSCSSSVFNCDVEAGYIYKVDSTHCYKQNRRMDFQGATEYWAKIDAELNAKTEATAIEAKKAEEEKEVLDYQADKNALGVAKSTADVDRIISSLKWRLNNGIHKDDPDNLMPQALQKRSVFEKAEAKENARLEAERKREEVKLAKEESIKKDAARRQLDSFRKLLKEGDETNCGPVIQAKNKLVQISFAVANYGNEHWIRRDMIFPSGYGCRFINGQYQPPQQF